MGAGRVTAEWEGGQDVTADIRGLRLAIGEDSTRPLPTEILLAAVASCFTIAMAFQAAKRGLDLPGLRVDVTGEYDGPRISAITISVHAQAAPELLERLIPLAERVCYVTNTLRRPPKITIRPGLG